MIGQIVKKWQPFFEIQDGGYHQFEFFKYALPTSSICSKSKSQCFHDFGDDGSNIKEMAAVFRNPRWHHPPRWKEHFRLNHHHEK